MPTTGAQRRMTSSTSAWRGGLSRSGVLVLIGVVYLGVTAMFCYAAVSEWRATIYAQTAPRIAGTVSGMYESGGGRSSACVGTYRSDDGTISGLHVQVAPYCGGKTTAHGSLVRALHIPNVDGINSTDTVYVDGAKGMALGEAYAICALLTACSVLTVGPLLIAGLALLRPSRRTRRGTHQR